MANPKVWIIKFVVGNPEIFSKIITDANGPRTRTNALIAAELMANHGWRVWVEHKDIPERRIYESEAEKKYQIRNS